MSGGGLSEALRLCIDSEYNKTEGRDMFRQAISMLEEKTLPTLIVIDSGTKGCPDFPASAGKVSPWEAMVNSEGHSEKSDDNALGSFGIGKHAPFAVTPLRTVLYSTCYETTNNDVDTRFIGRSILVSHKENQFSDYMSADGYLGGGDDGFQALTDERIPEKWRIDSLGTMIAVPGFKCDYEEDRGWDSTAFDSIIDSFFYAFLDNNLNMKLSDQVINKKTLLGTAGCNFDISSEKTIEYIKTCQTEPVSEYIEGIGDIKLHISVGGEYRRALALVRYPGLMITDTAKNMGEANPRIPSHWKPFTAVAFVHPRANDNVLKEAEAPSHDKISSQQVPFENRKLARKSLMDLSNFLYEEIKKIADVAVIVSDKGATEMEDFNLMIEDKSGEQVKQRCVTRPKQLRKSPKITSPYGQERLFDQPGENGGGEGNVRGGSKGKGKSNQTEKTIAKKIKTKIETHPHFIPYVQNGQIATHKMSVSMSTYEMKEEKADIYVSLLCLGEDENQKQIGLMQATCDGISLETIGNEMLLPKTLTENNKRLMIDMQTNEPITDKTFTLKCRKETKE